MKYLLRFGVEFEAMDDISAKQLMKRFVDGISHKDDIIDATFHLQALQGFGPPRNVVKLPFTIKHTNTEKES